MAVVGSAEFELNPRLADNFRQRVQQLISTSLAQVNAGAGALKNMARIGETMARAFGGRFTKVLGTVIEDGIVKINLQPLEDNVKSRVTSVTDFLAQKIAGVQNDLNEATAQAEFLAKFPVRRPALPAAGQSTFDAGRKQAQDEAIRARTIANAQVAAEKQKAEQIKAVRRREAEEAAALSKAQAETLARQQRANLKRQQDEAKLLAKEQEKVLRAREAAEKKAEAAAAREDRVRAQRAAKERRRLEEELKRRAQVGPFGRAVQGIQDRVDKFAKGLGIQGRAIAQLLGAGLTGSIFVVGARLIQRALEGLVRIAEQAIKAFGDLEDAVSATNLLFGTASKSILDFAFSADRITLSITGALKATQEFGTALQNTNLPDQAIAEISASFAKLAEDISSVTGVDVDTVISRLAQGIQGDVRSLRSLRINIRETDVEQEAFRLGLKLTGIELNATAKLAAFHSLVLKRTAFAQNDAKNTANSFNNSLAQVRKGWQNLLTVLGTSIGPAAADFLRRIARILDALVITLPVALRFIRELISGMLGALPGIKLYGLAFKVVTDSIQRFIEATRQERQALDQANIALEVAQAKIDNMNTLIREQYDVVVRTIQAENAYISAIHSQAQASLSLKQAEEGLFQARLQQTRQAFVIEQAETSLAQARLANRRATTADESASLDLRDARLALAQSERDLADTLDPSFVLEKTIEAQLNLAEATIAQIEANEKLKESNIDLQQTTFDVFLATNKLIQLRRRGTASAAELVKAQLDLAKAQKEARKTELEAQLDPLKAQRAILDEMKARRELGRIDTTIAEAREQADIANQRAIIGRIQAELGIEGALLDQKAAAQGVTAAAQAYADAQHAQLVLADQVKAAELGVLTARHGVKTATDEAAFAYIAYIDATRTASGEVFTQEERLKTLQSRLGDLSARSLPQTSTAFSILFGNITRGVQETSIEVENAGDAVKEALESIRKKMEEQFDLFLGHVATEIANFLKNAAVSTFLKLFGGQLGAFSPLSGLERRAGGGPVSSGRTYLVGERGPELFVPKQSGTVLASGQGTTNNFYINSNQDGRVVANIIARRIVRRAL